MADDSQATRWTLHQLFQGKVVDQDDVFWPFGSLRKWMFETSETEEGLELICSAGGSR